MSLTPKFLYRPVHPWHINQDFSENTICTDLKTGTKYISCNGLNPPKGYKSVYSMMMGHNGLDLMAKSWQPVYCACDGVVTEVQTERERGLGVSIKSKIGDQYFLHRYWHLNAIDVDFGEEVVAGTLLGYAGSTGISSGDHLHFEVKRVSKGGKILNYDNGYFGAIDPKPLLHKTTALEVNLLMKVKELTAQLLDKLSDKTRGK